MVTRLSEPHRTHLLDAAGTSRSEIRAQDVGLSPLGRAARFLSLPVWETSWQLRSQAGVGRVAAASQGYKYSATPSPKLSDWPVSMSDADYSEGLTIESSLCAGFSEEQEEPESTQRHQIRAGLSAGPCQSDEGWGRVSSCLALESRLGTWRSVVNTCCCRQGRKKLCTPFSR